MATLDVRVESELGSFDATLVNVHEKDRCTNHCPIHDPSEHPLRNAPMVWRPEKHLFERVCPHGTRHPDPDSLAYLYRLGNTHGSIHGCDGCCASE